MLWRTLSALLFGLVALLATSTGRADEDSSTHAFVWRRLPGAEGCIDFDRLELRVNQQLGRAAVGNANKTGDHVEGEIAPRRAHPGFHAFIRAWRGRTELGERELDSDEVDCAALDDSLTLVVALLVDPARAIGAEPEDVAGPVPAADTTRESLRALPNLAVATGAPDRATPTSSVEHVAWHGELRSEGAVAVGLAPSAAPGLRVAWAMIHAKWPAIDLGVAWFFDENASVSDGGGSFGELLGSVRLCPALIRKGAWRVDACAGVDAGAVFAQGAGFSQHVAHTVATVALDGGARIIGPIVGPLFATLGARAMVPFVRPDFVYGDAGATPLIYQPAAVAGLGEIGLGARIF